MIKRLLSDIFIVVCLSLFVWFVWLFYSKSQVSLMFLFVGFLCFSIFHISVREMYDYVVQQEQLESLRGQIVSTVECGCEYNGYVLPSGCLCMYDNSLSYIDADGYEYFNYRYDVYNFVSDLFEDCLRLSVMSGDTCVTQILFTSTSLNIRIIYDTLIRFGVNFDDEFVYFLNDQKDEAS